MLYLKKDNLLNIIIQININKYQIIIFNNKNVFNFNYII